MNPFESARIAAFKLRLELDALGVDLLLSGYELVKAACAVNDINLREVKPGVPLLKSADATINVVNKWILVRNDVEDEFKAFLVAHELGHWKLHPQTHGTVEVSRGALTGEAETNGVKEVDSYGARERQELQANVFAREFLLPKSEAREFFLTEAKSATAISEWRRLPAELVRLQLYDAVLLPQQVVSAKTYSLPKTPTKAQEPAVDSDYRYSLIEAGPGTGKTTTLLLRLRRLLRSSVNPESVVILTFSNKAARELVERARAGAIEGSDRVWIGTFHAFGLEFLRKFGGLIGLESDLPVLDKLAVLAMLEQDLPSLSLQGHDPLAYPSPWLETIFDTIKRSKDEVLDAKSFASAVEADSQPDAELLAKRRDVAAIFARCELLLKQRKAVDLNDLLCLSAQLMRSGDLNVESYLSGIQHLMVDEYQDVNRASALLVKAIGERSSTRTLWVVGDANQAIYAFMGASSSNLDNFQGDFPGAKGIPLALNHRSSQEIVDVFTEVARQKPAKRPVFALEAELGKVGHGPSLVVTSSDDEEVAALVWRIRQLEQQGTQLAEQAIIVPKNATAAALAIGVERLHVPVLYLGNIFERPEVKDLICLLQLAVDRYGVNLVREWDSPLLRLSRGAADLVFEKTRSEDKEWKEVATDELQGQDAAGLEMLRRLCSLVPANASPWDALANVLLEDGRWLRELAGRQGQAAANAMMAVWQFVHFCRSPDGTGRWATVKNLPRRIRDRVRLGEDRTMRVPPPEAEGLNAVRVLTAHGSKGLEFDAVHLLEVTKESFEEPAQDRPNRLLPDGVLSAKKASVARRNECHNLLYVAVSRPRLHLTVYGRANQPRPSALNGLLSELPHDWPSSEAAATPPGRSVQPTVVNMWDYIDFTKCPQRFEMGARTGGKSQRDEMKLHRLIDVATNWTMSALGEDPARRADGAWQATVEEALTKYDLVEHPAVSSIRQRVLTRAWHGRGFLAEGGQAGVVVKLPLGPLEVALAPHQLFESAGTRVLRFFRNAEGSFKTAQKQPLAALVDANRESGGPATDIEFAILSDGRKLSVGGIQAKTRPKYIEIATNLCSKHFPAEPEAPRTCLTCAYFFPCHKRTSE